MPESVTTSVRAPAAILLALSLLLPSCARPPCELCGRWRSNEEMTLREMERSVLPTPRQRAFFRDGFFGRLTMEVRADGFRAYFDDENPDNVAWEASTVVELADGTYLTRYTFQGEEVARNLRLEGDCYRIDQPELGFGEWFCRIE